MTAIGRFSYAGMTAQMARMDAAAQNVAAAPVKGATREEAQLSTQAGGGVQVKLSASNAPITTPGVDLVVSKDAQNGYMANLALFKGQVRAHDALLKLKA